MSSKESLPYPSSTEDHRDGDLHPLHAGHACNDGWVSIGQMVVDEETDEETEEHALYLCRRCASASEEVSR